MHGRINCFENMALTVTEDWIRERVKLKHNNLEDVRAVSLPGTYHEKISSLGESLRNFSRLKSLDLSRNAIDSLQGMESLKMLEKLILYYNNIPSLQELYRLRFNQRLQELDLRLNPVARNEPDYRLFLIHMLPNLRRLDDRAVRDGERKAALMHYATDQATELTEHAPRPLTPPQTSNPRAEHVKSLAKPPNVVDEDEAVLLDYASKTREELQQPRKVTGSSSTQPLMEEYPPQVARQMDRGYLTDQKEALPTFFSQPVSSGPASKSQSVAPQSTTAPMTDDLLKRYPNLMAPLNGSPETEYGLHAVPPKKNNRVQFSEDPNLQYQDEIEAYTSYKAQGHFTPHPDAASSSEQVDDEQQLPPQSTLEPSTGKPTYTMSGMNPSAELYIAGDNQEQTGFKDRIENQNDEQFAEETPPTGEFGQFVNKVSDLVDKYWNGSKSLLKNSRFKSHMASLFQELTEVPFGAPPTFPGSHSSTDVKHLRMELDRAREENTRLRERSLDNLEGESPAPEEGKGKMTLIRAQRDLSILRSRLQKSIEENNILENRIQQLEAQGISGTSNQTNTQPVDLGNINTDNERLRNEIKSLGIRLKQASQMQELASMLQESHKSLVQTNEHLLRELNETRQRHESEVKQLHWSYDQLKKTVGGTMAGYSSFPPNQSKTYNGAT